MASKISPNNIEVVLVVFGNGLVWMLDRRQKTLELEGLQEGLVGGLKGEIRWCFSRNLTLANFGCNVVNSGLELGTSTYVVILEYNKLAPLPRGCIGFTVIG
uniref:Uncharacterized protein n=1 Tax=Lygus hesperus TaxID=30085 RepID=A0A146L7U0_LYGHE